MIAFDLIVLVIFIFSVILGYQKGLIVGIAHLVGKVGALIAAILFFKPFLVLLENILPLRSFAEEHIEQFLTGLTAGWNYGEFLPLQPFLREAAKGATEYLLMILSIIILFIIIILIINCIIALIIKPLAKSVSFLDRGGGMLLGFLGTFLILAFLVGVFSPFINISGGILGDIASSKTYPFLAAGYEWILTAIHMYRSDLLLNPLNELMSHFSLF